MLISFVIPALNEEKDIARILREIKSLPHREKEIIVADGGSNDRTVEIAKTFADKVYERGSGKNISIAENRNKGAGLARGEILFFLDCRVKIVRFEEFTKQCLELFTKENDLVGITTKIRFFPHEEKLFDKIILGLMNFGFFVFNKLNIGLAIGWVQVVRTSAFRQINGYNENLITTEDNDLFRRLSKIGKTKCLKDFIAYKPAKRYHQYGWSKALGLWFVNLVYYFLFKKSYSQKWEEPPK